ncbi:MAG: serpin family protein [Patescibacteria group bacterium]|nr:serpin family protein [Patescibacteria group bacterium]
MLIVAALAIAGVGGYFVLNRQAPLPEPTPTPTPNPIENPSPTPTPIQIPKQPAQFQNPKNIPQAHNTFGFNSIKILVKEEGNKNVFISPSSIALALSMVYNGANGETKNAMQKTLQFQNLDIATVNQESLGLINSLKNPDPKVELSVVNSVWARNGVDFKKDFLSAVGSYFNAEISTLDFSNSNAANTINAWVDKNTKGKIPTIVTPPIPSDMVMYLINAVYFKGSWTTEFDKKLTEDRNFTTADGVSKKHPLMRQYGDLPYLEMEDFQSVNLPYGTNKRLSMYVFLPKNLNSFVQTLDTNKWNDWMKQYKETEGTILLPRFKMEYEKGLIPMLTQLGMGVAFQDNADLTGIGDSLKISEVKHKTYVDVNEEGTEAAAVTNVGVGTTSVMPAQKTFYMEVNRPFFFVIRDNQTQEVLFMGTIQNPSK